MQQILIMETYDGDLRSGAYGWDIECGAVAHYDFTKRISEKYRTINQVPVGLAGHPNGLFHTHATPLHALAGGWRLMAPPTKHITDERDYYEWWFEKTGVKIDD